MVPCLARSALFLAGFLLFLINFISFMFWLLCCSLIHCGFRFCCFRCFYTSLYIITPFLVPTVIFVNLCRLIFSLFLINLVPFAVAGLPFLAELLSFYGLASSTNCPVIKVVFFWDVWLFGCLLSVSFGYARLLFVSVMGREVFFSRALVFWFL